MPSKYIRKTVKAAWTSEQMEAALNEIHNGRSTRDVSRTFGIPRSTLQDRLKQGNTGSGPSMGRHPVFSKEDEKLLADQVIKLSKLFYGISPAEIKRCAFSYATRNGIKNPFSQNSQSAGKAWLRGFLKRNPSISLRKPEATSINRTTAFNNEEVSRFYNNLSTVMNKYNFSPTKIFNADETGITTVQKPGKIYAEKGQRRVGFITSAERGKTTTIMCAISASGMYVPPLFIYARKRMNAQLKRNGPPGALYCCSDNGWMNEKVFRQWLSHFQNFVKSSKEDPVLLLIDNHSTHCTLEAYIFCKENGITIVTIPPHTSHRLQPLDVSFYFALKTAYNAECSSYLKSHIGERITTNEIAEIFNKAYGRVATPEKATKGFQETGIFPLNPDRFSEEDFAPAAVFAAADTANLDETLREPNMKIACRSVEDKNETVTELHDTNKESDDNIQEPTATSFSDLIPVPGPSGLKTAKKKVQIVRKQHSEIFTSTPMKTLLDEKEDKKRQQQMKKIKEDAKSRGTKRKLIEEGDTQEQTTKVTKSRQSIKRNCKMAVIVRRESTSEDEATDSEEKEVNEDICIICGDIGKHREMWLRCCRCGQWAHEACADIERGIFVCDFCL